MKPQTQAVAKTEVKAGAETSRFSIEQLEERIAPRKGGKLGPPHDHDPHANHCPPGQCRDGDA